jgi:CSLREA domain-containing protein
VRGRWLLLGLLLAGAWALVPVSPAQAAEIFPTTLDDEFNDAPPCSLREAVRSAMLDAAIGGCPAGSGADTIRLGGGLYQLSLPGDEDLGLAGDLDPIGVITFVGAGVEHTAIDGGDLDRVLTVRPPDSGPATDIRIRGLSLRNGMSPLDIGGVWVQAGTSLELVNSEVVDNQTPGGTGGIRNDGALTILRTTIARNLSVDAVGGIGAGDQSVTTVTDSAIIGNTVDGEGAGGGISVQGDAQVTLTNVTVSGNDVRGSGGGINANLDPAGSLRLSNVTITNNRAGNPNVGSQAGGGINGSDGVEIQNSIVAGNLDRSASDPGNDCGDEVTSLGHNIVGDGTGCTFTPTTGDQVGTSGAPIDPKLASLADYGGRTQTQALLAGSPALDSGGPGCPPADQRGAPRSGACDRGAYELVLCRGTVVNRVGTEDEDVLKGTPGPDGFLALGGPDRVAGRGSADGACGGTGKDLIVGGRGSDRLAANAGKDFLLGGEGKDRLNGGPGRDKCNGGSNRDRASGCETEVRVP